MVSPDPDPPVQIVSGPVLPFEPGQLKKWQILSVYIVTAARLINNFEKWDEKWEIKKDEIDNFEEN